MIFKLIENIKYNKIFKLTVYLLICSLVLTINNGCYSFYDETYDNTPELKFPKISEYTILKVLMQNKDVIDLEDRDAHYYAVFNDKKNVIVYTDYNSDYQFIYLDDVQSVTIEKIGGIDPATTFLVSLGIAALIGLVILIAIFNNNAYL